MPENDDSALAQQKRIGERIKYSRQQQELSQEELAKKIGVNRAVMSRIENGTRPVRDIELSALADAFGVTTDFILGRKIDLGTTTVAAHLRNGLSLDDLPEERRQAVIDYMEYQKSLYKKEQEDKEKKD